MYIMYIDPKIYESFPRNLMQTKTEPLRTKQVFNQNR